MAIPANVDMVNKYVITAAKSDYCVVQNIADCVDKLLTSLIERGIELNDHEMEQLGDIFYCLNDGIAEYETAKEFESEVESLRDTLRDIAHMAEYA